eukprot:scpid77715/ scgid7578/ 
MKSRSLECYCLALIYAYIAIGMVRSASLPASQVQGQPQEQQISVTLQRCPVKSDAQLVRMLGSRRIPLQHFSPDALCENDPVSSVDSFPRDGKTISEQDLQAMLLAKRGHPNIVAPSAIPGCSEVDLDLLMAVTPRDIASDSPCQWRMQCDYDEFRFPRTLYEARMPRPRSGYQAVVCPRCRPVYRLLWVLRLVTPVPLLASASNGNIAADAARAECPQWSWAEQRIVVAYDCSGAYS